MSQTTQKLALALAIATVTVTAATTSGCDAYHRHPAATIAASAGLAAGAAGMTIGCGFIDDGTPGWQDTAQHDYRIAYVGLVVTGLAAAAFAALYPEGW